MSNADWQLLFDRRVHGDIFCVETQDGERHAVLDLIIYISDDPTKIEGCPSRFLSGPPAISIEGTPVGYPAMEHWPHEGVLPWRAFHGTLIRKDKAGESDNNTRLIVEDEVLVRPKHSGRWRALQPLATTGRRPVHGIQAVRFEFRGYNTEPPSGRSPHVLYNMPGVTWEFLTALLGDLDPIDADEI